MLLGARTWPVEVAWAPPLSVCPDLPSRCWGSWICCGHEFVCGLWISFFQFLGSLLFCFLLVYFLPLDAILILFSWYPIFYACSPSLATSASCSCGPWFRSARSVLSSCPVVTSWTVHPADWGFFWDLSHSHIWWALHFAMMRSDPLVAGCSGRPSW